MKQIPKAILLIIIALTLYLPACNNGKNAKNTNPDSTKQINFNDPTLIKFNGRLFSVPSPLQIAVLVKDLKIPYNNELLNSSKKYQDYTTSFKQAVNLGVYGADLGYLNIYEQLPDAAAYFAVVKTISKDLGILNTFNEETIKRIENNNNNRDSLIYILADIYREADTYLLNNDRNETGILIIAGGWVESMHIITSLLKTDRDQKIIDRIGEQKNPLNNLIELLRPYYGKISDEYDKFVEDLADLATIFDGVVIEYVYKEPTVDATNKTTVINSHSKTIITEQQIVQITEGIKKIRTKLIE